MKEPFTLKTLGLLNKYFIQWFFIRLAFLYSDDNKYEGWKILWGIIPTTGWKTSYKYLFKK